MTEPDVVRNTVREKLDRGEVVSSMTVRLVRGVEIARLARTAGFDSLYIDLEHSSFDILTANQICVAALDAGITPFVRVASTQPDHIARALDGGAMGVIAPHIRSAEDARRLVRAAFFPPQGERSYSPALPQTRYRPLSPEVTYRVVNAVTMLVVMIETREALEHVEEIAAVDGIDLLLVGTNDLSGELGIPGAYGHEKIRDAYRRTIAACAAAGKYTGVAGLASQPAIAASFVEMGARYVSTGTDLGFLLATATEKARAVAALTPPLKATT
jgi:2-keto-3-deoxy-L-rhamnonate aldolase RhmA